VCSVSDSDGDWISAGTESEYNWLNVTGLETGSEYEFRVIAMNGGSNTTASEPKKIRIGPQVGEYTVVLQELGYE
jgi:hypothetical protein